MSIKHNQLTLPALQLKRKEYRAAMRKIADNHLASGAPLTPAERQELLKQRADDDAAAVLASGEYSAGRAGGIVGGWPLPGALPSHAPRGGKLYRQMFGAASLSSDGFDSLESYLRIVHSGLHHPALQTAMLTQVGGVAGSGGFIVPEQFVAEMLDKSLESEIVRPRCDVRPMTSDTLKIAGFDGRNHTGGSLFGGFTGTWMAENDTATDVDPEYRLIQLTTKKLGIYTRASNELIADGSSFEQLLGEAMTMAVGWHLDYAALRGTGAGQPLGLLNDPALVTVSKETSQAATTLVYENLTKMFARLHPGCVNNSVWVANPTTIPQLLQLTITSGTSGTPVPVMSSTDGAFTMLTRPVLFTEKLPALGTVGDIILADFSQYSLGLRKEMALEKSIHVGWQSDTSGYRAILRADGQGRWGRVVTPRNGDTLSWAVALATRA